MKNSFDLALNYLTYKPRTEKEIRDYLLKKNYRSEVVEETIVKLKEYRYIDDTSYVKQIYENNKLGRRFGKKRLLYSLKNKGISEDDLEWLNQNLTDEEEEQNCYYHFTKLLDTTERLPYQKRVRKIMSSLQTKGFNYSSFNDFLTQIPKESKIDQEILLNLFNKAKRRYENKGYSKAELKNRIIKNLIGKGYSYSDIKKVIEESDDL